MTPLFRAAATVSNNSTTSAVCDEPTGTAERDVMLAFVAWDQKQRTLTPPAGWTLSEVNGDGGTLDPRFAVYYKVAGASEPSTYTFSWNLSCDAQVAILTYRFVDTVTPINIDGSLFSVATTGTQNAPSVTTTVDNTMVVAAAMVEASTTVSTPGSTTSRVALESVASVTVSLRVVEFAQASAGATGAKTFTFGASTGKAVGITVALTPGANPSMQMLI